MNPDDSQPLKPAFPDISQTAAQTTTIRSVQAAGNESAIGGAVTGFRASSSRMLVELAAALARNRRNS
jgi:hypothetical protein